MVIFLGGGTDRQAEDKATLEAKRAEGEARVEASETKARAAAAEARKMDRQRADADQSALDQAQLLQAEREASWKIWAILFLLG